MAVSREMTSRDLTSPRTAGGWLLLYGAVLATLMGIVSSPRRLIGASR